MLAKELIEFIRPLLMFCGLIFIQLWIIGVACYFAVGVYTTRRERKEREEEVLAAMEELEKIGQPTEFDDFDDGGKNGK
jgi:hypothetical protein